VIEKTWFVGGSTARSSGAFWIPANVILDDAGTQASPEHALRYLRAAVRDTAPDMRLRSYEAHGADTVAMLRRAAAYLSHSAFD
jgi:hypothetical protein